VVKRRRLIIAVIAALGLLAFLVFVGVHGDGQTRSAASAALVSIEGDDPTGGTGAKCDYRPDIKLVVLRTRYNCVVTSCKKVIGRVEITHTLGDGWRYRIRYAAAGTAARGGVGDTAPGPSPSLPKFSCKQSGACPLSPR
jgi:hypothetical protein